MAKNTLPKPVYAYVGVTDLAVEIVRDLVTETQTRIAGVQRTVVDPQALADRATTVVSARVDALAKDAKSRRDAIEARVAELQAEALSYPGKVQKLVDDSVDAATDTYADLVKRGESLVGRVRGQESTKRTVSSARTTKAKAKTTTTQARKAVDAETTATKRTTTARRNAAKKAPATKSTTKVTVTKSPATKTAASKSTASKTTASKTTASKSTVSPTATRGPARKAPTKQTNTAQSSAKATVTSAQKTASNATQAVTQAAEKVGD